MTYATSSSISQAELENTSINQCMEQDMTDKRLNCIQSGDRCQGQLEAEQRDDSMKSEGATCEELHLYLSRCSISHKLLCTVNLLLL